MAPAVQPGLLPAEVETRRRAILMVDARIRALIANELWYLEWRAWNRALL